MLPLINTSVPHKDSIMLYNVKQTTHQAVLISSPQGEAYIYEGNTSHQFPCNCMMFTFKQGAAIQSDLQCFTYNFACSLGIEFLILAPVA